MNGSGDRKLVRILLAALVFVLGFQSIRFLIASITWYLRDTIGIGTLDLIPIALAPFVAGAILPILSRWVGVRGALTGAVWLLALARVLNQVFSDPALEFWMAAAGTMAFVGAVPLLLSLGRETLVGGLLLGIALDSAIKGLSLSLDLSYQPGMLPLLAVAATGIATIYLAALIGPTQRRGPGWGGGALLLGLGPFLIIQYLVLQNPGWLAEVTGMGGQTASVRIAVLNAIALLVAVRFYKVKWLIWPALAIVIAAVALSEGDATTFNVLSLLAIPSAAVVLARLVPDPDRPSVAAAGFYVTAGLTLFVIFGLLYYVPLDLRLGFESSTALLAFGVIFGAFGVAAALREPLDTSAVGGQSWVLASAAALLPLFALIVVVTAAPTGFDSGTPVRYMSYNLHSAFNTDGSMDVEEIARVIEDSGATVVGLQEVPRGRLLSANTDLFFLLQNRLGFEHVAFFGTSDPVWGNAILSRYPIENVNRTLLPRVDTPLQRGYLGATLNIDGQSLLFISTHLQHLNDPDVHDEDPEADLYPVHHEQIATILEEWGGQQPAVLVGDFNARPGWQQMIELLDAGWVDSWDEAGSGDGFTSNAADPQYRIDYILHTLDLVAVDAGVIQSQASDHFAVVADIGS